MKIRRVLVSVLKGLDEALISYLVSVLSDYDGSEPLLDMVAQFLLSSGLTEDEEEAKKYCASLQTALEAAGLVKSTLDVQEFKKLDSAQSIEDRSREQDAEMNGIMERMWGFENIRKTKNEGMEAALTTQSQRQIRKEAKKEQIEEEKERMDAEEDLEWEEVRILPDMSTDNGERVRCQLVCLCERPRSPSYLYVSNVMNEYICFNGRTRIST